MPILIGFSDRTAGNFAGAIYHVELEDWERETSTKIGAAAWQHMHTLTSHATWAWDNMNEILATFDDYKTVYTWDSAARRWEKRT